MKGTILQLLQQRMDKCTTEQFWAVAVVTGFDAFALHTSPSATGVPAGAFAVASGIAAIVGVWYIVSRHRHYYVCRAAMASLLVDEEYAPPFLKGTPGASNVHTWLGTAFYVTWMLAGFGAVLWVSR